MTDTEAGLLVLLAKAVFVLMTAACLAQFVLRVQRTRQRGLHVLAPVLIWLGWVLVTFLAAFTVLALAHTHAATATLSMRVIAVGYVVLGGGLLVYLVRRIVNSG